MGSYYFTLNPSKMSWDAFKGYWGEKADQLSEKCKSDNSDYHLEFNPSKMSWSSFKGYWGEKADKLTEKCKADGCDSYIEFNPSKWDKNSFSFDRYSNFCHERIMDKNPVYRYVCNTLASNAKPITALSKSKTAEAKFIFDATSNAIYGKPVSDSYSVIEHKKDNNTGYEVFIQCSDENKMVIINYKDTDDMKDVLYSDIPMARGKAPGQIIQALESYKKIAEDYPDYKIVVTGLSLGGSLSELVASSPSAAKHGKTYGYSFNGYGVSGSVLKSCGKGFKDRGNVTAITAKSDRLVGRAAKHVGQEYIVNTDFDCFSDDWCHFHHISFMNDKMDSMAKNEDLYEKLLRPTMNIDSAYVKYP